ncbi:MAG: tRNA lysidine(34) synthetase TilS [Candidatus Gracilibacteria bacterium]|nr:tRNA lysidine(34) synthetase TilS [Candidatus Gracilibacteria bacterium]
MLNIERFLEKYYSPDEPIILACSTGPDSMYLLYEILKTPYKDNLVACYFNHKLRDEADNEEKWLENLGEKMGFKVEVGYAYIKDIQKLYPSKSLEELAREKRYAFLNAILNIYESKYIITAHHLDDKIETFFHNLLRGTKLTGLINMTENSGSILRPLLNLEKSEILKYLDENKLEYYIDETNKDNTITRNKLRNTIIPEFYEINSAFKKNLEKTMNYFEELKKFLDEEIEKFIGENNYFEIEKFNNLSSLLQKEIIRYIYFKTNGNSTIGLSENNILEVLKFINGPAGKSIKEIGKMKLNKEKKKIYFK